MDSAPSAASSLADAYVTEVEKPLPSRNTVASPPRVVTENE